jgi:hypothetical protein
LWAERYRDFTVFWTPERPPTPYIRLNITETCPGTSGTSAPISVYISLLVYLSIEDRQTDRRSFIYI